MNENIENALKFAESKGYSVSVHPTKTAIVKNFREYMTLAPLQDGKIAWSVREPMILIRRDGFASTFEEVKEVIEELR